MSKDKIIDRTTKFLARSNDFNGIPLTTHCEVTCTERIANLIKFDDSYKIPIEVLIIYMYPCSGNSIITLDLRKEFATLDSESKIALVFGQYPDVEWFTDRPTDHLLISEKYPSIPSQKLFQKCADQCPRTFRSSFLHLRLKLFE